MNRVPRLNGPAADSPASPARLASIDLVRGVIMLLMALDHVRYYFSDRPYQPEDIAETDLLLFLTRWITHFCAPGFFFVAGVGAWLAASRRPPGDMQHFLAARGLWMIGLELTIIGFAWSFVPGRSFAGVIWAFGWTFLGLATVLRVRSALIGLAGLAWFGVQDSIDLASPAGPAFDFVHAVLVRPGGTAIPVLGDWFVLFPILPWMAVALIGFGCGPLFVRPSGERRRVLLIAGVICVASFLVLRIGNLFGNPDTLWITGGPGDFGIDASLSRTLVSLLNTEKYPPSSQFLLMTLGPTLVLLGLLVRLDGRGSMPGPVTGVLTTIGRVPMFFYVVHLYLIHGLALVAAAIAGQRIDWLGWLGGGTHPRDGSGFGLPVVYAAWLFVCVVLWIACRRFAQIKRKHNDWWLRYL